MTSVVLQLDPASLGLWLGVPSSGDTTADETYIDASRAALNGDLAGVQASVQAAADETTALRAAGLASTLWHEMRHFADLTLSIFGSFKTRRYLSLYANMPALIAGLRADDGSLHCPITDYLDPVARLVHGLAEPHPELVPLLRDMHTRAEMLNDDLALLPTERGPISVGGRGQLEAIAYMGQSAALLAIFSDLERSVSALWDVPDPELVRNNYGWVTALQSLGLVQRTEVSKQLAVISGEPLLPLLIGCLATRHWGQAQVRNEESGGSGFPAERLYGLARRLGPTWRKRWPSWSEAWEQVNTVAAELWGRSVLEEMQEDVRRFGHLATQVTQKFGADEPLSRWVSELADVRRAMLALLEAEPGLILDVSQLPALAQVIDVPIISTAAAGQDYPLPPRHGVISAYTPPGEPAQAGWWWAAAYRFERTPGTIGFGDYEAWAAIASHAAPTAKLMIQGRRHRVMLGPELVTAEQILRHQGTDLHFASTVQVPDDDPRVDVYWFFRTAGTAICDLCRATVSRPDGALISSWIFRVDPRLGELAVASLGGGDLGLARLVRDWSGWLVCASCQRRLSDLVSPRFRHLVTGARQ